MLRGSGPCGTCSPRGPSGRSEREAAQPRLGIVILNPFSVVAAFAAVLRVVLGVLVVVVGVRALRRPSGAGEERYHLLLGLGVTLLGLGVLSWPLLYLVLDSYVPANGGPAWPGVMCGQGVARVGTGSVGPASLLPGLLAFLAVMKPLLVFVAGACLVLHLADRQRRTGALARRALAAFTLFGVLAVADSAAETGYLLIPKQEKFLAAGCCAAHAAAEAPPPPVAPPPTQRAPLTAAFLGVGAALVLALTAAIGRGGRWLALAFPLALLSLPLGLLFLCDVAAPTFLRLPYHRCAFCLARLRPETLLGIALYVLGAFGVGWAVAARLAARGGGTGEGISFPLLRMARFGYLGALLMAGVMLVSA